MEAVGTRAHARGADLILLHVALVECVYVTVPGTGYWGS